MELNEWPTLGYLFPGLSNDILQALHSYVFQQEEGKKTVKEYIDKPYLKQINY